MQYMYLLYIYSFTHATCPRKPTPKTFSLPTYSDNRVWHYRTIALRLCIVYGRPHTWMTQTFMNHHTHHTHPFNSYALSYIIICRKYIILYIYILTNHENLRYRESWWLFGVKTKTDIHSWRLVRRTYQLWQDLSPRLAISDTLYTI